ncbi:MAG: DUF2189 domain-containing protein [Proteobacteria bacterium]|nr:DUF2189 domain-containing protein [Pseudomonadota bacterium]
MHTVADHSLTPSLHVEVRKIRARRPFVWLGRAVVDLAKSFRVSVTYGLAMTLFGWMLLTVLGAHPYLIAASVTGFLLVAPVMATGLCELSRRLQEGLPAGFDDSLEPLRREDRALLAYGGILALVAVLWLLVSEVLLSGVLRLPAPSLTNAFYLGVAQDLTRERIVAYVATGGLLALAVFCMSVVTVPLIISRHARAGEAIRTSLAVIRRNPLPMAIWAAMIVVLTAAGFATLLCGMILVIPLLGHATWRAYRDLIAS